MKKYIRIVWRSGKVECYGYRGDSTIQAPGGGNLSVEEAWGRVLNDCYPFGERMLEVRKDIESKGHKCADDRVTNAYLLGHRMFRNPVMLAEYRLVQDKQMEDEG